jgi:hypothetical protein
MWVEWGGKGSKRKDKEEVSVAKVTTAFDW